MEYPMSFDREDVTIDVVVELTCTYKGHPGRGPSLDGPGDPPEPPEFDAKVTKAVLTNPETMEETPVNLTPEEERKAFNDAMDQAMNEDWWR